MNRPQLRSVPSVPAEQKKLTNEQRKKRITSLRKSLLTACVNYAIDGEKEHERHVWQERVREASDWSGIPRTLIESEVARTKRE